MVHIVDENAPNGIKTTPGRGRKTIASKPSGSRRTKMAGSSRRSSESKSSNRRRSLDGRLGAGSFSSLSPGSDATMDSVTFRQLLEGGEVPVL
ncbi:unnamed protein product, partial [Choristocarpus tenellus]